MIRIALIAIALAACSDAKHEDKPAAPVAPAAAPAAAPVVAAAPAAAAEPRNLVCERVKLVNKEAECEPELTDEGELHTHRARVTEKTKDGATIIVCTLTDRQVTAACDSLFPAPKKDPAAEASATKGSKK